MDRKSRSKKPTFGRPNTLGRSVAVTIRLPKDLSQEVDAWADQTGIGRSEAMRQLIEIGLRANKGGR
jgi:hypothetical protein